MSKRKLLTAVLMVITMVLSGFVLAACKDEPCTDHKDADGNGKCDICGTDWTDIDLTEGVYNVKMGNYELLIKFYDEDTFYFQNETAGFRGKYEMKEETITYAATQDDGSIMDTGVHGDKAKWLTGDKVLYFYKEDGTTPIDYVLNSSETSAHNASVIPAGVGYAHGTKAHTLAFNSETDKIMSFKGAYGSRTLSHTKLRNFSVKDEKAIVQAKYMVNELPDNAEAGEVESDYFLLLSQKGYESNIPALSALEIDMGSFTHNGNTYTLTDTISGATATLTVTTDGATVTKGDTTIQLIEWEDVTPYAVEATGNAFGGKIEAKVRFNEDGTLKIFGSTKNYSGKYKANQDGTVTVSDVDKDSPVTIGTVSFATVEEVTTLTAILTVATGMETPSTAQVTAIGTVTGKLFGLESAVLMTVESTETVFGDNKMSLEMKDDCTLTLSVGGQSKVTAFWALNIADKAIAFKKTAPGTMAYDWNSGSPKITWTGRLSTQETTDSTYTFAFAAADLGKLLGAKVAQKHTVSGNEWNTRATKVVFYADGTLEVNVADGKGGFSAIATADWIFGMSGGKPAVTITESSNGKMTADWGTGETDGKYVFTWVGKVNPQMPNDSTLVFAMPTAELAKLQ